VAVAVESRRLDADVLTRDEVERLLKACSARASTGQRNRAMIVVAWRAGLRIGEVLALHTKDVDLDEGVVRVQHGKGDKPRVVGLDAGAAAVVAKWVTTRRKLEISNSRPLFCTLQGEPIRQDYVRHLLPRLARKAGINKRVHAHGLRHAYAVELEREGAPLSTIRDLLGHSSAAITDRYLRRHGAGAAVEFARSREWQLAKNE
jgi:site-specific recombinase XerD